MTLDGQTIVVIGGSSGLGLSTARAAALDGAEVTIASSRQERVDAALSELPDGCVGTAMDVRDETQVAPGAALAAAGAGAAEGLVRGLAVDLAPVRVNAVRAGAFRTPLWDGVPGAQREALFARLAQGTLTGTVGEPVAPPARFYFVAIWALSTRRPLLAGAGTGRRCVAKKASRV